MNKLWLSLSLTLCLISCDGGPVKENELKLAGDVYTIMDIKSNDVASKLTMNLQLKNRLSEDSLKLIATEIKANNPNSKRIFIFYYLQGEKSSGIAWATTHYTPDLEVNILGSTEQEETDAHVDKFGLTYDQRKEIFQDSYRQEVAARKKADAKYPMLTAEEAQRDSKKYAEYKNLLTEQAQKNIMKKYNISEDVFWEISTEGVELDWIPKAVY